MFYFKQFSVRQEKSAMKIGTDSVILGAWTPEITLKNVLDIGSGTGVLSLMISQRFNPEKVDAVEIDPDAFLECKENFSASKWRDILNCYNIDIKDFAQNTFNQKKYDLIISNPPFFSENALTAKSKRQIARQQTMLYFKDLAKCVKILLTNSGLFCVIIPFLQEEDFIEEMSKQELFAQKITRVKGTKNSAFKRSLICFASKKINTEINQLIIEHQRHIYTQEYIDLTKDFYIKF